MGMYHSLNPNNTLTVCISLAALIFHYTLKMSFKAKHKSFSIY